MAVWTQAEWADKALEALGVKAATQGASAEDGATSQAAARSLFERLQNEGLTNFEISAVPEWAQTPMQDILAWELVPSFGVSNQRRQDLNQRGAPGGTGRKELAKALQGIRTAAPTRFKAY